jgi:hypothetical protein
VSLFTQRPADDKVLFVRAPAAAETYAEEPQLTAAQQRALDDLRARGIAITTFDELIGDQALWHELDGEMQQFVARAEALAPKLPRPDRKDQFLIRRWRPDKFGGVLDDPVIPSDSPWLRFAASDTLLDVVNSYRGVYAKVLDLDNWFTVPFPEDYERVASQRWHRDPEDLHVVKCFLYFSDVDEEAGPFEYAAGSAGGGRYGDLWPWGVDDMWYPPVEELEAKIPASDRLTLTGARGTLILCDTSGFHRGGHARSNPRILATHTYVSPATEWEKMFWEIAWREGHELSRQARYALTR